jgi:hypothetical protein
MLAPEDDVVPMPADNNYSFVDAAALGMAAHVSGDMFKMAQKKGTFPEGGGRCLVLGNKKQKKQTHPCHLSQECKRATFMLVHMHNTRKHQRPRPSRSWNLTSIAVPNLLLNTKR